MENTMYELSPNLEQRIKDLIASEPTSDDFTTFTVNINDQERQQMSGKELRQRQEASQEKAGEIIGRLQNEIGDDPEKKMEMEEFQEWFKENVSPHVDEFEVVEHDFDQTAFSEAAGAYHKETLSIRAQFKDEIIEHYGLRDSEDAVYWIMEAGGEGIPTLDVPTVIKAFDSLVNGIDPNEEVKDDSNEGVLEA